MEVEARLKWALEVLNPDNLVATPDDKMKAWLYLKEFLLIMLIE